MASTDEHLHQGRRGLTVEMIRVIHAAWSVPLECLIDVGKRAA